MARVFPPGFIGTNIVPFYGGGVYGLMQNGFSMFASNKITATITATNTSTNTITVSGVTGGTIAAGKYVLGIGIPPLDSNADFARVDSSYTSGNNIKITTNISQDLTGLEVHFYDDPYSIEFQMELMGTSGIELLRVGATWDDFENGTRTRTTASGLINTNQITVSDPTGITIGSYVIQSTSNVSNAIPGLGVSSNWKIARVTDIDGNVITLNVNLIRTINNVTVNFYDTSTYKIPDFTSGGRNDNIGPFNLDQMMYLASKNGVEVMPRLSGPPVWEVNYDTRYNADAPFMSQDPESDDPIIGGIKIFATGTSGSTTLNIADMSRGHLIKKNMVITSGGGIPFNAKVTGISKTDKYTITLSAPLTSNVNQYITASIKNWSTNNPTNGSTPSTSNYDTDTVFDNLSDLNIYIAHVFGKGGQEPKSYDNFVRFSNAIINRYGNNGTFWDDTDIWGSKTSISLTASGTVSNTKYGQTLTVSSTKDLAIGMIVESLDVTGTPSTKKDSNLSYISEKTKICAISKNTITLTKALNKNMPSGTQIIAKYPRVTNWQIYNEFDLCSAPRFRSLIKASSTTKHVIYYVSDNLKDKPSHPRGKYIGSNWPQKPYSVPQPTGTKTSGSSLAFSSANPTHINRDNYSWAPSILKLVEKIKKDAHTVDPDAKIVLGALASDSDPKLITSSISNVDSMGSCQIVFDPTVGNGKSKMDKISVNRYRGIYSDMYSTVISKMMNFVNNNYYIRTASQPPAVTSDIKPNLIYSEYGFSTIAAEPWYTKSKYDWPVTTEGGQKTQMDALFSSGFNSYITNTIWPVDSLMYYKWASDQTYSASGPTNPSAAGDKWKGLYKYTTTTTSLTAPAITFDAKPAAQSISNNAIAKEGRI